MRFIPRFLEKALREAADQYPLEDPDTLDFAQTDPRGFLNQAQHTGLIIDEAQR
jgi:hypothetical protein